MAAHGLFLVGTQAKERTRAGGAGQYETGIAVGGEIAAGGRIINFARYQAGGAGQAPADAATGREFDTGAGGSVPEELTGADFERHFAFRQEEGDGIKQSSE